MSSSFDTEQELQELASRMRAEADCLEEAARILVDLREVTPEDRVRNIKERARKWMARK